MHPSKIRILSVIVVLTFANLLVAHEGEESNAKHPIRVLVYSDTAYYRHPDIPTINRWLVLEGDKRHIQIDVSEHPRDLKANVLNKYDVLLLNNANKLADVIPESERTSVEAWYKAGHGIVAIHATLVMQQGWPWLMNLGGCDFNSDSEFLKAKIMVDASAMDHPTVKGHGKEFWYTADWTNHTNSVTGLEGVQVLLRVDESTYDPVRDYFKTRDGKAMGDDHPIAWTREYEGGRFFYTELGHDLRSLETDFAKQHVFEAIKWASEPSKKTKE